MKTRTEQIEDLAKATLKFLPDFGDSEEKRIAVGLYRLLANGDPVLPSRLADRLSLPSDRVGLALKSWNDILYDDEGGIVAFYGLNLSRTNQRLTVDGRTLHTWCAWDTLFIPGILGLDASVESECPVSGERIRLTVTAQGLRDIEPESTVMSFLVLGAEKTQFELRENFCCYVHFFRSRQDGREWVSKHEGTFLISLDEAYQLGQVVNQARIGDRHLLCGE